MKKNIRCIFTTVSFLIIIVFFGCKGTPAPLTTPDIGSASYDDYLSVEAEELVRTGVRYHDMGDYEAALNYYSQAMESSPNHPIIFYEMGLSYIYLDDYEAALEMAERGIAEAKTRRDIEVIPSLLELKGSVLDNLGRSDEAIDAYLEALNQYGVSNTFLYYNLAVSYYRVDRRQDAAEALARGLLINRNHASSNYLLGKISMEDGRITQAFYSLCYFLLLEPNSDRALQSYNTILYMLNPEDTIEIRLRDNGAFTASDMIISVAFSLDDENYHLSDTEKTSAKLYYVLTTLDEQKNSGTIGRSDGDELWWDIYSPFFYWIAVSDYFSTFCRYIALSTDPDMDDWIENGRDEIEGFFEWLNSYIE